MTDTNSRRQFLKLGGATSVGLIHAVVAGQSMLISPAQARADQAQFQVLNAAQVTTLDSLAEILVPGAQAAGVSHFVDAQLAGKAADSLLMIKYLGVPAPHSQFYVAALEALSSAVQGEFKKPITELNEQQTDKLVALMVQDGFEAWAGPPSSFVYFVLRSDAVDVVYGSESGFAGIGMPGLEHIKPPSTW